MIRTLFFIVIAGAAILGAVWLAERPGAFVIDWLGWHIEMPVPMLLAAIAMVVIVAALLYRGWRWLTAIPGELAGWRRESKRGKGYRALTQGMVAVAAGDPAEAQKQARRADVLLNEPPLTMLLSAQAAQLNGDEAAARRYFEAMLERPETAFLGLRGLLMQAQRDGDEGEALRLAARARKLQPRTPWVLRTLFDLQLQESQWRPALATLEDAAKRGALESGEAKRLRIIVLLGCSQEAEGLGDANNALDFAKKAQHNAPDDLAATLRYAQLLAAAGKTRAVEKLAREAWDRNPHPELVRLYLEAGGKLAPLAAIKRLDKLVAANRGHAESHIALARAHLNAEIWGAARSHLEAACEDDPPARVCRMMAELEERENSGQTGESGGDMAAVRRWLMRASIAAPDPAWICSGCGAQSAGWNLRCARCDELGTLEWRAQERGQALTSDVNSESVPGSNDDAHAAPTLVAAAVLETSAVPGAAGGAPIDGPPPIPPRLGGADKA
jgi:HemY protein